VIDCVLIHRPASSVVLLSLLLEAGAVMCHVCHACYAMIGDLASEWLLYLFRIRREVALGEIILLQPRAPNTKAFSASEIFAVLSGNEGD
jgi:hypothetical protein